MELKIKDRDYVADGAGGLVRVSGWDELLERVLFKLSVRRGSFALAPELGSKLHLLWREKGESRATAAKQYAAGAGGRRGPERDGRGACGKEWIFGAARAAAL